MPPAGLAVIVSDKYEGTPGIGGSLPLGNPQVGDGWVCLLTGIWGQLGLHDSVGVYNGPSGWYLNVTSTSGGPLAASAACAATASGVSVTTVGQVIATGVNQATMCALAEIENDGTAWGSPSSYEQVSWGDSNPNNSPSEWWSSASSDVSAHRQTVCASLSTTGKFFSPGVVPGSSSTWHPPPGLMGGGLCGLTLVQGDFDDNDNSGKGVFLTVDTGTGDWTLTAVSGMTGGAYCVW